MARDERGGLAVRLVQGQVLKARAVVRNIGLYYLMNFRFWLKKAAKTAKFRNVTAPFWAEKVLKTANFPNSRKARSFLSDDK